MAEPENSFLRNLLVTFRSEADEHLQRIVSDIVLLEQAADDARSGFSERILKSLHTLKGAARAANMVDMEALCHAMEGVFSALRKSANGLTPIKFDLLHQASELARLLVEPPSGRVRNRVAKLTAELDRLSHELAVHELPGMVPESEARSAAVEGDAMDSAAEDAGKRAAANVSDDMPDRGSSSFMRVQPEYIDAIRYQTEALLMVELEMQHHIDMLIELARETAGERNSLRTEADGQQREWHERRTAARRSERALPVQQRPWVQVGESPHRLNELIRKNKKFEGECRRLADELGKTRRKFALARSGLMDANLEAALVPISLALDHLPGTVRNVARRHGKQVGVKVEGEHIRIDRRLLDIVRETVVHLATNAVCHGIETPGERIAAGKPPVGEIRLNVSQQSGNYLTLSIADDGAGMDAARIIDAAIRNGSLDPDHLASFSESQRLDLALQAGVSTSTEVTQDAGRGIGLAIVAEKIASIGGSLSIENCPGTGCLFILSVPTRLATLQALVIGVAGSRYIFPLSGIESVCTLDSTSIQTIEGRETVVKEGGVLPVIRLGQLLGHRPGGAREMHERTALVLRAGKGMCALLVEEILSIQEILPKSLGDQLQRVRYVSGAAQLGDGSLVLILKPEDILRYGFEASGIAAPIASPGSSAAASKRLLVVEDSITSRLLLKHILEGAGYQVETAVDGLDGLAKMRQGRFDGVISDIEMPHMDGFGLTESVRADAGMRETPIVLVSTLQSPAEKTRGFHAGADAYVVKGAFDQDNLIATVRRLV